MCEKEKVKCLICGEQTKYVIDVFSRYHLKKFHPEIKNQKEYYDKYIKKEGEGICPMCGNETGYLGYYKGYSKYCIHCIGKNEEIRQKQRETFYKNIDKNIESYKESCKNRTEEQIKQAKKRRDATNLERYGTINPVSFGSENFKNSMIKKYGEDNIFKTDEFKEKLKKENLEKYGVENYCQSQEYIKNNKEKSDKKRFERIKNWIQPFNQYELVESKNKNSIIIKCSKCGEFFEITSSMLLFRLRNDQEICRVCNPAISYSIKERCLYSFIKNNYSDEILLNKKIYKRNELDVYLKNINLAFEFNGLYWHSIKNKKFNCHYNKTKWCENKGIHLIQVYEDDWEFKKDVIESNILKLINKCNRIDSNICDIKEISSNESKIFYEENSLYKYKESKYNYGLFYNNLLVYLFSVNDNCVSFCEIKNLIIDDAFEKIFNYFINNNDIHQLYLFLDYSWYKKEKCFKNFNFEEWTGLNKYYIVNNKRYDGLIDKIKNKKYLTIYDSGSLKYVWKRDGGK